MSVDQGQSPRPIDQCRDLQDVLDQIRLRPSMWVRQGRLRDLQNILIGYATALSVHGVEEPFALSPGGPFAEWLCARRGWSMSCGWADAIERHADGEDPLTIFFHLLDEYRSASTSEP
ncbi:hypothetical protein [Streptomyces hawaiiensis]|uniref:hypothetical protein n=1 Tax=Streptomyces hawaiiensis TaxID=67305 RepID=UPI0036665F72